MSNAINKTLVRIRGSAFEESPFLDCYETPDMLRGVYAGRFFPISNGEDTVETYWALRRRAALYDVPERPVEIAGPDVVAFLERIFARRISTLKEGRGRYAIACTPQGGVFMDGILFKMAENRFWYVQPDGALETWLVAHSAGFDITISDPMSRVLQIQGPASPAVMRAASSGAIEESMGYFHSGFFDLGGQELYVSRTGWTGELGYEVYTQGDRTDHRRLWDHLTRAGEPHGMAFSGALSMEIRRMEAGILNNISDMDTSMTPFQAGLGAFIDMDKDDFIGRAALVDADRRTVLYGIKCETATPVSGYEIVEDAQARGRVTAGSRSPFLSCGIGYVRFDRADAWEGRTLALKKPDGALHPCTIVDLPFYDPEKRIARGLDKEIP